MRRLNLKAEDANAQIVLDYLEKNASDSLIERINGGEKTISQCWNYIISQAKEQAQNGCACIDDATAFGWAIHFFEEDSINSKDYEKTPRTSGTTVAKEAPKVAKKPKEKAPDPDDGQISFDSFFN